VLKGESLQQFVNEAVSQRPLEALKKPFGAVATDLHSGDSIVFRTGNTGIAVRASATVPGVFQPVKVSGREYVDGGLSSLIPVRAARQMGSDVVIAVDISARPGNQPVRSTFDILMQTFTIMGQSLGRYELKEADVVIRPQVAASVRPISRRAMTRSSREKRLPRRLCRRFARLCAGPVGTEVVSHCEQRPRLPFRRGRRCA
jgi:NTE family protein